jgi:TonB-dependent receptor
MFKKNKLSSAMIAVMAGTTAMASSAVFAQDAEETLIVTGIRASLQSSMNTKRDAVGVVDAITAEDIGKFPDTNLAESLQRITGVSISRVNGEGSQITVRGFGGDNNMVTLNGRQVPGGGLFGGGGSGTIGGTARAFDFSNLASESVSAVEVYKTGRADVTSGGIGATVNIKTARPLDNPGLKASIGAKALMDTSSEDSNVTPEISGIVSYSTDMWGVGFTGSYQERDSGFAGASVNDWNIRAWDASANQYSMSSGGVVQNAPADGQLYARPNDLRYEIAEGHRERTNAQLTVQFAPSDALTLTADALYAENVRAEDRSETTLWMANQNSVDLVVFDDSPVASPLYVEESVNNKDNGQEQTKREQTNKLTLIGFNAEWAVTDTFKLNFDVASSKETSDPTLPNDVGEIAFTMAIGNLNGQTWDWDRDLPLYTMSIDDSAATSKGNHNGVADISDVGTQILRTWSQWQETTLDHVKIDGELEFDNGKFSFGVESKSMEVLRQNSGQRYMAMGDWGVGYPGDVPDDMISQYHWQDFFNDYDTNDEFVSRGDALDLANWATSATYVPYDSGVSGPYDPVDHPDGNVSFDNSGFMVAPNTPLGNDDSVKEDSSALFLQVQVTGQLGDWPTNTVAGVRFETTNVTSDSRLRPPPYLIWQDNNDFAAGSFTGSAATVNTIESGYDNLLPSLDYDISFTDDLKGRASFSKTMARASVGSMFSAVSGIGTNGSTYNGAIPSANRGNPGLIPLESSNFDLSLEWYFADTSYASVGFFEKRVANFIGTDQVDEPQLGILDQTNGPRVQQAAALLEQIGVSIDDTSLFAMTALVDNPTAFPDPAAAFVTDAGNATVVDNAWAASIAATYDIIPEAGDPATVFRTSIPVNNREAKLYGSELAVQHFFGETGFGVQANYTIVRGDVGFDDEGDPGIAQFALTGLSDTANLVLMYDNYGLQARLAYNWRDKYLNQTNRGNSRNPVYVDSYDQIDMNVSYNITDNFSVAFEALNVLGSNIRQYGRTETQLWYLNDLSPRYTLGARYTF